jgi:hypothetical protein
VERSDDDAGRERPDATTTFEREAAGATADAPPADTGRAVDPETNEARGASRDDSHPPVGLARTEATAVERRGELSQRRGPKTREGKARVAFNAVKHGISAKIAVIPGVERAQDWDTFRDETLRDLAPEGFLETALAERVAACGWRLRRVVAFETACIAAEQAEVEDEVEAWRPQLRGDDDCGYSPTRFDLDAKLQELDNTMWLLKRLWKMPSDEPLEIEEAVAILQAVAEAADVGWQEVTVPGVPKDVAPENFGKWTVKPMRAAIIILGEKAARTPEGLIKAAKRLVRRKRESAQRCHAKLERALAKHRAHLQRRHLLPDREILERIQRYEAHLIRQGAHALHELEAAQDRRRGNAAPLARVDIQGVPPADDSP